uniref:Uncharacterized protein n=4 Tax=Aegilops tauschii subsp. strangulata TaxID=200361 RepID=A0A453A753_AEGTS
DTSGCCYATNRQLHILTPPTPSQIETAHSTPHQPVHHRPLPEMLRRLAARRPRQGRTRAAAAAAYRSSAAASSSVLPDALDRSSDAYAHNAAAVGGLLSDLRSRVSQVRACRRSLSPSSTRPLHLPVT